MKIRNDFVSNSSSCSFIIKVNTDEDVEHLENPDQKKLLEKYARYVSYAYDKMWDGTPLYDVSNIDVGDFIMIYTGEDNDGEYLELYDELADVAHNLNKGYGKLKIYVDPDAHISLGEEYEEEK